MRRMLAVQKDYYDNIDNIVCFPGNNEPWNYKSTRMECLYDDEEVNRLNEIFIRHIQIANTYKRRKKAIRDLTMYQCSINIGLRGGDFCNLRWFSIYDEEWNIKNHEDFIPQKTTKRNDNGEIIKRKYVRLIYNDNFKGAIERWRQFLIDNGEDIDIRDYIFLGTNKNSIKEKTWYDKVEDYRKEAGIEQKIGTHGLRKTFGRRYYMAAENKWDALIQLKRIFRHSSPEVTLLYICVTDQEIYDNIKKICVEEGHGDFGFVNYDGGDK